MLLLYFLETRISQAINQSNFVLFEKSYYACKFHNLFNDAKNQTSETLQMEELQHFYWGQRDPMELHQ